RMETACDTNDVACWPTASATALAGFDNAAPPWAGIDNGVRMPAPEYGISRFREESACPSTRPPHIWTFLSHRQAALQTYLGMISTLPELFLPAVVNPRCLAASASARRTASSRTSRSTSAVASRRRSDVTPGCA